MNDITKSKIRILLYCLLFFVAFLYGAQILVGVHLLAKCMIGAALLGFAILLTIDRPLRQLTKGMKFNKTITILWFALGAMQLISGLLVSREYLPMALIWLVELPILFITWVARGDHKQLFYEVAFAGNICGVIAIAMSITMVPLTLEIYGGAFINPNALGQWMTALFPMVLFLHHQKHSVSIWKWAYRVELALIIFLCLASEGRTGLLAIAAMLVVFATLKIASEQGKVVVYAKEAILSIVFFLFVSTCAFGINQLCAPTLSSLLPELEGINSTRYSLTNSLAERLTGADKHTDDLDLEDYSSGRTGIWIGAIDSINLLGHPSREHIVTGRNGDVGSNTHNAVLQIAYDNGIIAGVLFTSLIICSIAQLGKRFLRCRSLEPIESFYLILHVGYCCTAMLASVNLPFLYIISLIYYLSFSVLFGHYDDKPPIDKAEEWTTIAATKEKYC